MDSISMIESKMSKVESSLNKLTDEILSALEYLCQLRENSAAVVKELNNITVPAIYLEEFVNVNSFLLKAISFLTEFNCKFEILHITEKPLNSILLSKKTLAMTKNKNESDLNSESLGELITDESSEMLEKAIFEKQTKALILDNQTKKEKKKKNKSVKKEKIKSKCDKSWVETHKKKNIDVTVTADSFNDTCSNSKSNNISTSIEHNRYNTSHSAEVKAKSNSEIHLKLQTCLDDKNNFKEILHFEKVVGEMLDKNGRQLNSETYVPTIKSFISDNDEKHEQTNVGSFHSSVDNLLEYISSTETSSCGSQSSGNIPPAEVTEIKIKDKSSEEFEYFNCTLDSSGYVQANKFKTENLLDEIKPAKLIRKLGEEYDVAIEYIKSPSEFYVSIIDNETNLLMELENKLKKIPANKNISRNTRNEFSKAVLYKEIGNYGLVYSKCDEMWCRVKITNWCLNYNDDFVNVFLLDYGEHKCVSIYDLQVIPDYLKQYPAFTLRCHLFDVFPVDIEKDSGTLSWTKESSEGLRSLTEVSKKIRMRIAPNDNFHPGTSLPVTLWLVDQDNVCVNELLVRQKFAINGAIFEKLEKKTEVLDTPTLENDILNNWNPMKEDFESYKNSYDLDINDPSAIIYGYVGKDHERICTHFAKHGYCFKGGACRKEHKALDNLGFTTDQEEVYISAINNLVIPLLKTKLNIQVTCLVDCTKFFCFMEDHSLPSQEEDLHSLLNFMNRKENILEMKKLLIPPSAGQIVIARYSVDEAWYRARVVESQPEKDEYTVIFVDYGNDETLRLSDIRAIEARYLHLPFQAIQCCIYGIEKNPEAPFEEVMAFMKDRMKDGHLSIEVISKLPGDNINLLVNVFDRDGVNIGLDLVAKNYAVHKNEIIVNSDSESIPG